MDNRSQRMKDTDLWLTAVDLGEDVPFESVDKGGELSLNEHMEAVFCPQWWLVTGVLGLPNSPTPSLQLIIAISHERAAQAAIEMSAGSFTVLTVAQVGMRVLYMLRPDGEFVSVGF